VFFPVSAAAFVAGAVYGVWNVWAHGKIPMGAGLLRGGRGLGGLGRGLGGGAQAQSQGEADGHHAHRHWTSGHPKRSPSRRWFSMHVTTHPPT